MNAIKKIVCGKNGFPYIELMDNGYVCIYGEPNSDDPYDHIKLTNEKFAIMIASKTNTKFVQFTGWNDGLIRLTIESEKGIIKSSKNTIITLDDADISSITTELSAI